MNYSTPLGLDLSALRLLSDLTWATMLTEASGAEDTAFELRQWSPHELWFHTRSRGEGVPDGHFGRTRWAAGLFEPLPARRASFAGQRIDLLRPDLDALRRSDATLTRVLEERRSIRRYDDECPITVEQIGEFLYRTAGVRATLVHEGVEVMTGPNPSGGALDELEFYLAVRLATGLDAGLYRYDRFGHRLERVCGPTRPVRRLIDAAQNATGGSHVSPETYPPQLVVLLAAPFGRVGWSYETLVYSLILKHVGVAYQTMYCVATAMGLYRREIDFLGYFGPSAERSFLGYRDSVAVLIGAGRMLVETVEAALRCGSRRLRVAVTGECPATMNLLAECERHARQRDPHQRITHMAADLADEEQLSEVLAGADIVAYVCDPADFDRARTLDRVCARAGVPFVSAIPAGDHAWLGPFGPATDRWPGWMGAWRRLLALDGADAGRLRRTAGPDGPTADLDGPAAGPEGPAAGPIPHWSSPWTTTLSCTRTMKPPPASVS